ncbi:BTB/POZ domain-containing protein NPY4-like [Andrographis paniculata]|uniref:BTB/POZ domain-containing protein NPY4-like n=1 Tax=Andrographis paniculata TaxID=175694 RepID=UPI0021E7EC89|nr:BTB/POZ domain-containing protein NPY4-like [Andrographis paniculata]XP_051115536.1 BTB/POZ domain-containing protein NPY4-like [Andrographis paniculata]XP_051115537.1 BTB/POZ domain-containing protein NPY4-like [Andrographis paniculata]
MKFMKLGSKPDLFQTEGDNVRYVATELSTDLVISVGDVKFYIHKFPLLSKSSRLRSLAAAIASSCDIDSEINIDNIPGGPAAFEICAKFCYGMVVTLNAYNVVAARCAAEYLEMHENVEKGNLVFKIDVFLASGIFRSWKDSIILLSKTKPFLSYLEGSKVVTHCVESIAMRACTDLSRVDWSYTYNRLRKQQTAPEDWWAEDLCDLSIDLYKRVITSIKGKGILSGSIIGAALRAYTVKRLPGFGQGVIPGSGDLLKYRYVVDSIISLLPREAGSVKCGFLLNLLSASIILECGETGRRDLMRRISGQLEEAAVADLLISGETTMYNVDVVCDLVEQFASARREDCRSEFGFDLNDSTAKVARLVDGYLAVVARDPSLPLSKFIALAEMVYDYPRSSHDRIYRAIDAYLKEHLEMTKSEKKRICRLMDCRRLSSEASAHAVENERLPSRVAVQILFCEQTRGSAAMAPRGSSRSLQCATTANSDDDWESCRAFGELGDLKDQLRRIKNGSVNSRNGREGKSGTPRKVKMILSRLWSNRSSLDMSESSSSTIEPSAGVK